MLHEISDNLLQFKPFNYPRKLTFFRKNQQFACLINAFAYVSVKALRKADFLGKMDS
jgi:hypothetical protein